MLTRGRIEKSNQSKGRTGNRSNSRLKGNKKSLLDMLKRGSSEKRQSKTRKCKFKSFLEVTKQRQGWGKHNGLNN